MKKSLLHDICAYLEAMKARGLYITVHFNNARLTAQMVELSRYNIHDHPFCRLIKTNSDAWCHCIQRQKKIYERAAQGSGPFWGMCYAGMEEYIFPLKDWSNPQTIYGFVSVSGYGVNSVRASPRISAAANRYFLRETSLLEAYGTLCPQQPDLKELSVWLMPLCHMLNCLYGKTCPDSQAGESSNNLLVARILEYIHRNYQSDITIPVLSSLCFVSPSTISHTFKRETGYSIRGYIRRIRIQNAKDLLLSTSLPIHQIAEATGFSQPNFFTNTFQKETGLSPTEYRRQHLLP